MTYEIKIKGMTCGGCISAVKMAIMSNKDVTIKEVKIGKAVVETKPQNIENIKNSISYYGYTVEEIKELQN
ncbi:MAG: heavy-metal-associated domain-containing protein [Brevinematia bacterium]|jgi:copper chaperone CopZ